MYNSLAQLAQEKIASSSLANTCIYPASVCQVEDTLIFLVNQNYKKLLVLLSPTNGVSKKFTGTIEEKGDDFITTCPLTTENADALRALLPFTAPVAFGRQAFSIGLGDRLGRASVGHLRILKEAFPMVKPVLAQQSMRELVLTNRTYQDVLDSATWAVFQEGWRGGFGADGDHLKNLEDILDALKLGYSMITLDCSDEIENSINLLSQEELIESYEAFSQDQRNAWEAEYLGTPIKLGEKNLPFDRLELAKNVLIYGKAIDHVKKIYQEAIIPCKRAIDFELSIDETPTPTTPQAHYFVTNELKKQNVDLTSVAPRFCGEFQKGIDYIGDISQFEKEFTLHAAIADHFGYRLSIHSGSDKFSVFPIIEKETNGRVHVKTAGTNWLEALRLVAKKSPELLQEMYTYALENFDEARKLYHVTTDLSLLPTPGNLSPEELEKLLVENDTRQVLHITYGILLNAKNSDGSFLFKDRFFDLLDREEDAYADILKSHFHNHLAPLTKK